MKYLKLLFSILVAIVFLVLVNTHTAQAETNTTQAVTRSSGKCCIKTWRGVLCGRKAKGGETDRIDRSEDKKPRFPNKSGFPDVDIRQLHTEQSEASFRQFIDIGVNIAQGQAKVDDYFLFAYLNAVDENFTEAENSYSQALELALKNKDIEGQAVALNNLGEVSLATGNIKEAVFQLKFARYMYQSLGNEKRVGEVQQRLEEIERLLKVNPSGSKIEPSQLQLDLSRI